jgi:hypothetical protein
VDQQEVTVTPQTTMVTNSEGRRLLQVQAQLQLQVHMALDSRYVDHYNTVHYKHRITN